MSMSVRGRKASTVCVVVSRSEVCGEGVGCVDGREKALGNRSWDCQGHSGQVGFKRALAATA